MAHIEEIKNKKGTAFRVHYSINGRPLKQYFPAGTPKNAIKTFIADIENKKLKNKINNNAAGIQLLETKSITLEQLRDKYINTRRFDIQIGPHVLTFKRLLNFFDPDTPIHQIDHNRINEYKSHRFSYKMNKYKNPSWEQEQRARRGVNNEYSNARTIFTWAYNNDMIPRNPFDKTSKFKADEVMLKIPTRDEERRFYRELYSWQARLAFWLMRLAGLRRSEVRNLKHKHLDTDREIIIIEKQKNRKVKILPMHPALSRLVKRFKRKYNIQGEPENFIFNFNKDYLSSTYKRAVKRAGIEIKSPVHILRHAFVTTTLKETEDIALTKNLARHNDFSTTERYLHLIPEDYREKFGKINFGRSSNKIPKK